MGLKEKSIELMMSIPHFAILWEMRKHQRYVPRDGLDIEIKSNNEKIYALLIDICIGGMRCVSTDKRLENSKVISLSVDDFIVKLPCKNVRKFDYTYGIKFPKIDAQQLKGLISFIEKYTKITPKNATFDFMK